MNEPPLPPPPQASSLRRRALAGGLAAVVIVIVIIVIVQVRHHNSSAIITAQITLENCSTASDVPSVSDSFTLRRPGNGLTEGEVLEVGEVDPTSVGTNQELDTCLFTINFPVQATDRVFVVKDEHDGDEWGPFSYEQIKNSRWELSLNA